MTWRARRASFGLVLLAVAAALLLSKVCVAADRPNIVFMLSDDQHWNGLSVAMHPDIPASQSDVCQTPWLEKLAAQGMRFSAAYAPASVCSPTRASLLTGKSPAQLHWTKAAPTMSAADGYKLISPRINKSISTDETTIAELLRAAGYATAHYGKWHLKGGGRVGVSHAFHTEARKCSPPSCEPKSTLTGPGHAHRG